MGIKSELVFRKSPESRPYPESSAWRGQSDSIKLENGPDPVYEYILGWKDGIGRSPADRLLIYLHAEIMMIDLYVDVVRSKMELSLLFRPGYTGRPHAAGFEFGSPCALPFCL
jgi:hypothetical protein